LIGVRKKVNVNVELGVETEKVKAAYNEVSQTGQEVVNRAKQAVTQLQQTAVQVQKQMQQAPFRCKLRSVTRMTAACRQ
jgi:hypothetical protein